MSSGQQPPTPIIRLDIAQLRLPREHPAYEDGVACIKAYWKQAAGMTTAEQTQMISEIRKCRFWINPSCRGGASTHRLYREAERGMNTWGIWCILNALYYRVPLAYRKRVTAKFGEDRVLADLSQQYLAQYPDTILPSLIDRNSAGALNFKIMYPLLRNIPYWASMGLEEILLSSVQPLASQTAREASTSASLRRCCATTIGHFRGCRPPHFTDFGRPAAAPNPNSVTTFEEFLAREEVRQHRFTTPTWYIASSLCLDEALHQGLKMAPESVLDNRLSHASEIRNGGRNDGK
ncbi:hypothetical protein HDV63DRAFT_407746 [Trichoderma sp. SZMC 28014]